MFCCFKRHNNSDIQVNSPRDVEANLRGQLISSWQYITDRDTEIKELKVEISTLKEQTDKILHSFENTQKTLSSLKKRNHRHRNRAHRYRKDNVILCQHLKTLTQNHPALGAEESEIVSKAIVRHNQNKIKLQTGSDSSNSGDVYSVSNSEDISTPELPSACWTTENATQ